MTGPSRSQDDQVQDHTNPMGNSQIIDDLEINERLLQIVDELRKRQGVSLDPREVLREALIYFGTLLEDPHFLPLGPLPPEDLLHD